VKAVEAICSTLDGEDAAGVALTSGGTATASAAAGVEMLSDDTAA
jgi:hypothetical protein